MKDDSVKGGVFNTSSIYPRIRRQARAAWRALAGWAAGVHFYLLDMMTIRKAPTVVSDPSLVLLVRVDAIGDYVLWLRVAGEFRCEFPLGSHRLILVANHLWAPLAEAAGLFDEVIPVDCARFCRDRRYRRERALRVRAIGAGRAIQPTYSREMPVGDSLIRMSGAATRVGYRGDATNTPSLLKRWTDRWYTTLVVSPPGIVSELERNRHFAEVLRKRRVALGSGRTLLLPSKRPIRGQGKPYAVVVPGGSWDSKLWPIARFEEIVRRIVAAMNWNVVVVGSAGEEKLGMRLATVCEGIVNLVGRTSILELIGLIDDAELVLSNDTGAAHIAAALETPAVVILGGGHFGRFFPYPDEIGAAGKPRLACRDMACFGCGWNCIFSKRKEDPVKCISDVSVEEVWSSVRDVLYKNRILAKSL